MHANVCVCAFLCEYVCVCVVSVCLRENGCEHVFDRNTHTDRERERERERVRV